MNKSDSIKNLAISLSKFQSEIHNPANTAKNPFFNSKYAPLNDVLNLVRPILSKYGLSIIQSPAGDGQNVSITTILIHDSGEWIESETLTLKADKATAQGAGSAITYARRYALSAVLGISSEDDDDGNGASKEDKKKPDAKPQAPTKAESNLISKDKAQSLHITATTKGVNAEKLKAWMEKNIGRIVTSFTELTEDDAKKLEAALKLMPDLVNAAQRKILEGLRQDVVLDILREHKYTEAKQVKANQYGFILQQIQKCIEKIETEEGQNKAS